MGLDEAFPVSDHPSWTHDAGPGALDVSAGQLPIFERAQLPGTIWTTDGRLRLTFVQSPAFQRLSLAPDRLIGCSLAGLVADGDHEHVVVEAHRAALDGTWSPVDLQWGRHRITGMVGPLRDRAGAVVGCIGLAHAEEVAVTDERLDDRAAGLARRRTLDACGDLLRRNSDLMQAMPAALALLCREYAWTGASVWTWSEETGRLTHVGEHGVDRKGRATLEPLAWTAIQRRTGLLTADSAGYAVPLVTAGATNGALAVTGTSGDLGSLDTDPAISPAIRLLARELTRHAPRRGLFRTVRQRVWLSACLLPLPFMVWAC